MPRIYKRRISPSEELYYRDNYESKTPSEWKEYFGCKNSPIRYLNKKFGIKRVYKCSEETKAKIGAKRRRWLSDNPDKHPWRSKDKFKSEPCEKVKEFLMKLKVQFIPEYQPNLDGRHFSIDIAIPDKLIALEINGNQHYDKKGVLKPYYQERHDLLEKNGWTVYEIHYSACFNLEKWADFVDAITNSQIKTEFNYFSYIPPEQKESKHCACGKDICYDSIHCRKCARRFIKSRYQYPTPEEMKKLVWEIPASILRKTLGMSDVSIGKFCKKHGIEKPPRGYWQKKKYGAL